MLRLLPILFLVMQSIPFAAPLEVAEASSQKMSCCGGHCKCSANGCQCSKDKQEAPAPAKTPFTTKSLDLCPSFTTAQYQLPTLAITSETVAVPTTKRNFASNNCRQALLGRWQN
ncbi:hypothetical protein H8D29_04275 [PVC group bacterium]|nr:hypothetical protein [PVC group bacterium]